MPDDLLENGPEEELSRMFNEMVEDDLASGRHLTATIVFTGDNFARNAAEALRYLPGGGRRKLNGYEVRGWNTKAGTFYRFTLEDGTQAGVLVTGPFHRAGSYH